MNSKPPIKSNRNPSLGMAVALLLATFTPLRNGVAAGSPASLTLSGVAVEKTELIATVYDANGFAGGIDFEWFRDGAPIGNISGASYHLSQADVNTIISVTASFTDGTGNLENPSVASTSIINVNDEPSVKLSGVRSQYNRLSVSVSDPDGLGGTISYQWQRDGVAIENATEYRYKLTQVDVDREISLALSYIDDHGSFESVNIDAGPISNTNDKPDLTIDGDMFQGSLYQAKVVDLDGIDSVISYIWKRNGVEIPGETASSYRLRQIDVDKNIRVDVSYTDRFGRFEQAARSKGPVANINDLGTISLSGEATLGSTLSAILDDLDGLSAVAYEWYRDGVIQTGQSHGVYILSDADVGAVISVTARYVDNYGHHESPSSSSDTVLRVNRSGTLKLIGDLIQGQTLSVEPTDLDGISTPIRYIWQRDGQDLSAQSSDQLVLGQQDVGHTIGVRSQYSDAYGNDETPSVTSNDKVLNINDLGQLTLSGTLQEDEKITSTLSDLDGLFHADGSPIAIEYEWTRDGQIIANAQSSSYRLDQVDVGKTIGLNARYRDFYLHNEQISESVSLAIKNRNDPGELSLGGTTEQGETLTAQLYDADGVSSNVDYQWLRNQQAITAANTAQYQLQQADVGAEISATAHYYDDFGSEETLNANAASIIGNINDVGILKIFGTAIQGQTLQATLSDLDGIDAASVSYQWQRNDQAIDNANTALYQLQQLDVGTDISVLASYIDDDGHKENVKQIVNTPIADLNDAPILATPLILQKAIEDAPFSFTLPAATFSDAEQNESELEIRYSQIPPWLRLDQNTLSGVAGDEQTQNQQRVTITAIDHEGLSVSTALVIDVEARNDPTLGGLKIDGFAEVSNILSVNTSELSDADGIGSFDYQWFRGAMALEGVTTASYLINQTDENSVLSVEAIHLDGQGFAQTLKAEVKVIKTATIPSLVDNQAPGTPSSAVEVIDLDPESETVTANEIDGQQESGANSETETGLAVEVPVESPWTAAALAAEIEAIGEKPPGFNPANIDAIASLLSAHEQALSTELLQQAIEQVDQSLQQLESAATDASAESTAEALEAIAGLEALNPANSALYQQKLRDRSDLDIKTVQHAIAVANQQSLDLENALNSADLDIDQLAQIAQSLELEKIDPALQSAVINRLHQGLGLSGFNRIRDGVDSAIKQAKEHPVLWLEITQGRDETPRDRIYRADGNTTVFASIGNPNSNSTEFDWSLSDPEVLAARIGLAGTDTLGLNNAKLKNGHYRVAVTARRSGNVAHASLMLSIVEIEGISAKEKDDIDGDFIIDRHDRILDGSDDLNRARKLQLERGIEDRYLLSTQLGVKLRLGPQAREGQLQQAHLQDFLQTQPLEFMNPEGEKIRITSAQHDYIADFEAVSLPAAGASIPVVLPLRETLKQGAAYYKYHPATGWMVFIEDRANRLFSAAGDPANPGICPVFDSYLYQPGLKPGDLCVLLEIEDGGPNDADRMDRNGQSTVDKGLNGKIVDPGTILYAAPSTEAASAEIDPYDGFQAGVAAGSVSWGLIGSMLALLVAARTKARHLRQARRKDEVA